MEFVELQRLPNEAEVEHITTAGPLASLVRDVYMVLVDLGMLPIPEIPQDPPVAGDVLVAVGVILEHVRKAYASRNGPWD
jgi:hypothetical protein